MKAAYVCTDPGVPVFGAKGGSVHVQSVLRALLARGVEVTLFARRLGGEPPAGLESVPVRRLSKPPKGQTPERERFLLDANAEVRRQLEVEPGLDLIYERHALFAHGGMEYAREAGIPGLLEVNAPLVEEQQRFRTLGFVDEAEESRHRCFAAANSLLTVSRPLGEWAASRTATPVHVVPNGVDTSLFGPSVRATRPAEKGVITIGFVGSLRPWHGVEVLAESFRRLRTRGVPVRLLIVGDGPMRESIESACTSCIDDVLFAGAVQPEQVPGLLASVDIAVAPYPRMDDFYFSPLKLFEYMAAGVGIIASSSGQVADVIEHDRTGLLVEPGSPEALLDALSRLVEDRALCRRLGSAARKAAADRHGWDSVVGRVLALAAECGEVPA